MAFDKIILTYANNALRTNRVEQPNFSSTQTVILRRAFSYIFMGQTCSCLDHKFSKIRTRRRGSSMESENHDIDNTHPTQTEIDVLLQDNSMPKKAAMVFVEKQEFRTFDGGMTKRAGKILDHESAYIAFVNRGQNSPPSTTKSALNDTVTTLIAKCKVLTSLIQEIGLLPDLECVMCLDTFCDDNPKVRTLCNCGMNRTNFHLACLYQWLDRNNNCPVCREFLYFEEHNEC
jgi:hypothetical protein